MATDDEPAVLTAQRWPTNAEMIEDVARLGYLEGSVLDCTYGYGTFWNRYKPADFTGCDIDPEKSPIGYSVDFTALPFDKGSFNVVVFDPPYKLNGRSTDSVDERYGVHVPSRWQDRHILMGKGLEECARVAKSYVLMKCMDQVVSGAKRWQTIEFGVLGQDLGMDLVDRFDMLVTPRPQPEGRRQVHAQANYSTLLVFGR